MFEALRYPHYRLLWGGQAFTGLGMGMQMLATGWLAVVIANQEGRPELSPLYLGLLGLARGLPGVMFGLLGGVVADWVDRRFLLWAARIVHGANAAILAALTYSGHVNIALMMAVTVVSGVAMAMSGPAQMVMLSRVVPPKALMSAVSLNQGTMQSTQLIGPLIAGLLIIPAGIAGVMVANAIVFALALALMTGLAPSPPDRDPGQRRSASGALSALLEGLRYVAGEPTTRWILITSAVAGITARPVHQMLPAVAHDVLGVGATELSWLLAAQSIGAIGGTAFAASIGNVKHRGLLVSAAVVAWGAMTFAFAEQRQLAPAVALIFLVGFPHWVFSGTMIVLLQTRTPDRYRGRVMSVQMLTVQGVSQIGALLLGTLGAILGVDTAIAIAGLLFALFGVFLLVRVDAIRRLGTQDEHTLERDTA